MVHDALSRSNEIFVDDRDALCPICEWGGAHDVDFLRLHRFKRAATGCSVYARPLVICGHSPRQPR
jgi:hypothetical protein